MQHSFWGCSQTPIEVMAIGESHPPSVTEPESDSFTSKHTSRSNRKSRRQPSATVESQATPKQTTWKGKSLGCNSSTPQQKSSKTLASASTGEEQDLRPYWNDRCQEIRLGKPLRKTDSGSLGYPPGLQLLNARKKAIRGHRKGQSVFGCVPQQPRGRC